MKDVNDLMQAILEMDAAQRKAEEKAKAERTVRLAALDAGKQAIAAECSAKAQAEAQTAADEAEKANADALTALKTERAQALQAMRDTAQKQQSAWVDELVRRALGKEAAQ